MKNPQDNMIYGASEKSPKFIKADDIRSMLGAVSPSKLERNIFESIKTEEEKRRLYDMTYGISFLRTNKDAEEYIRKYCTKHKITEEQALEHLLVKGVLEIYEKKEQKEADV